MFYISKYLEFNHAEIKFKLKENDLPYIVTNLSNKLKNTSSIFYLLVSIFEVLPKQYSKNDVK